MSNALSNVRKLDAVTIPASGTAAAVQAAIDSLGAAGGTVILSKSVSSYDFGGVTIKPNITIQGPFELLGSPAINSSAPYGALGGAIIGKLSSHGGAKEGGSYGGRRKSKCRVD